MVLAFADQKLVELNLLANKLDGKELRQPMRNMLMILTSYKQLISEILN